MGSLGDDGVEVIASAPADLARPIASASPGGDPGVDILLAANFVDVSIALVSGLRGARAGAAVVAWNVADETHHYPALHGDSARLRAALEDHPHAPCPDGVHWLYNEGGDRCAIAMACADDGSAPLDAECQRLLALAGRRVQDLYAARRADASLVELSRAQQLQRALLDIADMTGCERDMPTLLKGLHDIIGRLMYAENIYIALCDRDCGTLRFIYFRDTEEMGGPTPAEELPLSDLEGGLTWYLLKDAKPLMGSMDSLRAQVSGPLEIIGPHSNDWLGVPMLRDGEAVGALVVQSYQEAALYTPSDREVLAFVAGHVLNAVERKQRQENLESSVRDRTSELARSNELLRQEVLQRMRGEHLQSTLYQIAALSSADDQSDSFYSHIHRSVGELINVENFYIALLSDDGQTLEFPYRVDTSHPPRIARPIGRGLSEYVMGQGKALLVDRAGIGRLVASAEIMPPDEPVAMFWLGVPLLGSDGVMGVVAVQSYRPDLSYDDNDSALLTFVSHQIASSLQRRNHAEALARMNAQLEKRVEQRTQELSEQIAVREQIEDKLKHQVMHDPLTGLPNRLYLRERLERSFAALRQTPGHRIAVLYLDVDRFKLFNDNLGHLAGDQVLREVGRRLMACVRDPDVVARLSGDEFAILLEDAQVAESACKVAERILSCFEAPVRIGDRDLQLSASIGVAISDARHRAADELLLDADVALYRAKSAGRKRYVLFDESLQRSATNVFEIEQDLRRALNVGQFEPYFQPLVRLSTGETVGYEALIRWNHPERGMLLPGQFLSVAEDSGLMETIDWEMYRLACIAGRELVRGGGYMTINISPRHFQDAGFGERLLGLTALTGFDPSRLRIEVTESTLLGDPDAVAGILSNLKAAGVETALDDFGTGYSSLGYVNLFPLKMIKIDRSFIMPLGSESAHRSSAIVSAILALSERLGVEVLGEGVETEVQRQALIDMGCEFGQGFLFARPQPASHWLRPDDKVLSAASDSTHRRWNDDA